jgi:4-diphosphocytidyl-2-C-methyl-D-erythritol kinase
MKHTFYAPAKVNLFLKVLSKRPDGYHNIISLVDPIALYDVIHIEEIDDDAILVRDNKGVLPDGYGNTLYRAAKLLKETFSIHKGVRIDVEKMIPIGSGLGGPSSDAATVLKGLSKIWQLSITDEGLMGIGKIIGADVPLFLYGKPCIMEGIGDIITPMDLPTLYYLIVYPGVIVQTKEVYGRLKIVLTNKENDIKLMGNFKSIDGIVNSLENDLEQVGISMCPEIKTIKDKIMEAGALGALMSGSGSSVFGIFHNDMDARRASPFVQNMGSVFIINSSGRGNAYGDH